MKKTSKDNTRYFRARYQTQSGSMVDEVYVETSLEAAKDYAIKHAGERALSDIKEYPDLYTALTDD